LEIRKRKPKHSTLQAVEFKATDARAKQKDAIEKATTEYENAVKKTEEEKEAAFSKFKKMFEDLQAKQQRGEEVDPAQVKAAQMQFVIKQRTEERAADVKKTQLARARDLELAKIERQRDQQIQRIQNEYKLQATIFPPILPLMVGLVVWARRRIREREGVSRTRMRL
jgi:ABC-2 type transport system permease protein